MAFMLRRPFAVVPALKQAPKASSTIIRAVDKKPFKSAAKSSFTSRTSAPTLTQPHNGFRDAFRRSFMQQASNAQRGELRQRLLSGAGISGGTLLVINFIFNRKTREDSGMLPHERNYLNETSLNMGLGIGTVGVATRALHMNGWSYRLMSANPWVVFGVGLVGTVSTMCGCMATPPDNSAQKYALWGAFNLTQATLLSPLVFLQPALLARAGLYTVGMMGSIAFVGATARQEKYLYLGAPLLAAVAIGALSGIAPMVLPATATRTLMWTENIWLYGGLSVFGGFTLYGVQKVLHHARLAERDLIKRDPVNEAISLELGFFNIFVLLVQILGMQQNRRK